MGRAYLQVGRIDDALKRAQQGAILPPVSADALYYLGQAYEAKGDTANAKQAYAQALELDETLTAARDAFNRLP